MTSTLEGRGDITSAQKRKIMRDNAAKLYGWN
jgi:predicted TIM-barrel fold metal-dependent hydrolase